MSNWDSIAEFSKILYYSPSDRIIIKYLIFRITVTTVKGFMYINMKGSYDNE